MTRIRKTDIPGVDRRVSLDDIREKGWPALFAPDLDPPLRLVVEIGFGRGEFLRHMAEAEPATAYVGVEISRKRVLKMARRLARDEIGNVRLLAEPAQALLEQGLPDEGVAAFWVNFPDPWPKKRHHKNRLLQAPLVRQLAKRLAPGGQLEIATDHAEYAEHIAEVLRAETLLENLNAPAPYASEVPGRLHTAYEEMWRADGRALHFFSYRRRLA